MAWVTENRIGWPFRASRDGIWSRVVRTVIAEKDTRP
jgi:hypothetical protein